jgi:hypothetical protein
MLHPAVMISDFLESHAFPFVLQFCSRSFLCPTFPVSSANPQQSAYFTPQPPIALPLRGIELVPNHTSSLNLEPISLLLNQCFLRLFHTSVFLF